MSQGPGEKDDELGPQELQREVGVGPWEGPLPAGEHWDGELLRDGDRRNVVDAYRYWSREAIVADLDTRRHGFHVAIENWQHDFNIGTVVRTANAFLAQEVHIIGKKRWNRRGAMVTDRYQHVRHHPTVEDFVAWAQDAGLPVLGVDLFPDSVPLETFSLPRDCVLVFGQEGPGLSDQIRDAAAATLSIAQFGSTRSINAGVAAGIAMHAWVRQHAAPGGADGSDHGAPLG
ncbi:RNA methyltransferase [Nesterenkonia sp. NBAIMH1]|uniref:TrmH family RNA methyltransferase n=1 Tax=Nesterenkonia sp. NBAIMH1 TaxID=2600320 RepID=UPI0011B5F3FD|nr:RNA methyltransferase [Nesterenkonia sp. NBAIMH1]